MKIKKISSPRYVTTDGREHVNESTAIAHQAQLELAHMFRATVITSATVAGELLKRRDEISTILKKASAGIARAKMREMAKPTANS